MSEDTKVLLTGAPPIQDILDFAQTLYKNVCLRSTTGGKLYTLEFSDGNNRRCVSIYPPGECASDYADVCSGPAVYMSMGHWGNSEVIARRFAVKFGGLIMPNDCTDDWQNP